MRAPEQRQTSWNSHLSRNSKALPTDSGGKQGSKHHFHKHAHQLSTHRIFHGPSSSLQDSQAKHVLSKTSACLKKGAQLFQKELWGSHEADISLCPQPHILPPPSCSQEAEKAETSLEENSSSSNRPPRSSFKWLSDPFKQI